MMQFISSHLVGALKTGHRHDIPDLPTSIDSLAVGKIRKQASHVLMIAENPVEALRLQAEIKWFYPDWQVDFFPDWETLPYDQFSPNQGLVSERLSVLNRLLKNTADILIVSAETILGRLPPTSYLTAYVFSIKVNQVICRDNFLAQLLEGGYEPVSQVLSSGEFAQRGGLLDIFPMGSAIPYRIELEDDQVCSLRAFDVDTQRTLYKVSDISLMPAREFEVTDEAKKRFRMKFRAIFPGDASKINLYRDISNGTWPAGIEYYLPLFFEQTATLFDYISQDTVLIFHHDVAGAIEKFNEELKNRYRIFSADRSRPILPPQAIFMNAEEFYLKTKSFRAVQVKRVLNAPESVHHMQPTVALPPLSVDRKAKNPYSKLSDFVASFLSKEGRILLMCESLGRKEVLLENLKQCDFQPVECEHYADFLQSDCPVMITVSPLFSGFFLGESMALITENELFENHVRQLPKPGKRFSLEGWLKDLSELKVGDFIVHETHGIGRYLGLEMIEDSGEEVEFLRLEYANHATLYVPVSQLQLISRHSSSDHGTRLHTLGSGQWEKARKQAAEQVKDTAAELLHLYASRVDCQSQKIKIDKDALATFSGGFPFEETEDQLAAIMAVLSDLGSAKPMDRLVCGDVGFGKTEVALRAAFAVAYSGQQVAILAPTTLLVEQHFQNFSDRFADFPIKVAEISRFKSAGEQLDILSKLKNGQVDIVIGTHRLIQKDIQFKNLGLLVIDEEHRFGVQQKERLKSYRTDVNILTLTATPIPRTLGFALEGLREFSIISTPPPMRLKIKTFVYKMSLSLVREACMREFKRGGQVYFLHNDVSTLETQKRELEAILPEAKIVIGHGQMPERVLEKVMRDFTKQQFNVLLCSTIIETGIDNPHANTIIIHRADKFGLAQLHQLRGRVGRSYHQAYAYLFTHEEIKPTPRAQQRLEAIQSMEDLGAGFFLAMHDLEIRGAGEILGQAQSGQIQEVGFSLYANMLNEAVKALKSGEAIPDLNKPLAITSEIDLHAAALLPEKFCADVKERLTLYKRLSDTQDHGLLQTMREEMVDRFGLLPMPVKRLLEIHRIRIDANVLGIIQIDASENQVKLMFNVERLQKLYDINSLIDLLEKEPCLRLKGEDMLLWLQGGVSYEERVKLVDHIFSILKTCIL